MGFFGKKPFKIWDFFVIIFFMKKRLYSINYAYTNLQTIFPSDDLTDYDQKKYTEKNGYYKSKEKATFVMLSKRLEKESDSFRRKKLKLKINKILDESPEVAI